MKKLIISLFGIVLFAGMLSPAVFAASTLQSGTCGDSITWNLDTDGLLTINGTGAMTDYELYSDVPWYNRRVQVKAVSIGNNVTRIGDLAFNRLEELTTVSIPDSVTSIGDYAFSSCKKLSSIDIPAKVTTIGLGAFYDCDSLSTIDIPYGVKKIQDKTFYSCGALTSVSIPNSVTSIGEDAFVICSSLSSVTIPDSVTSIHESAFQQCTKLQTVVFGKNVSSISYCAFYYCGNLRTIIFTGNAPSTIKSDSFKKVNAAAYYPPKNETWTEDKKANYGGTLTWLTWTCEKLGQEHSVLVDEATAPTCTETGLAVGSHCGVCDEVLVAQEVIPALGHSWNAATCTTAKTCSVCGTTEGNALGHSYESVVTAPTCTEQGFTTHTCNRCENSHTDSYTAPAGHSFGDWAQSKVPTCTENGEEKRECTACDHFETQEVTATGHNYSAGLCTTCGDDVVTAFLDENTLSLTGELAEGTRILVACYDGDGRFTNVKILIWQGVSIAEEIPIGEKVKLFFVDGNWVPLRKFIPLR